jgi:hypothetical protein
MSGDCRLMNERSASRCFSSLSVSGRGLESPALSGLRLVAVYMCSSVCVVVREREGEGRVGRAQPPPLSGQFNSSELARVMKSFRHED